MHHKSHHKISSRLFAKIAVPTFICFHRANKGRKNNKMVCHAAEDGNGSAVHESNNTRSDSTSSKSGLGGNQNRTEEVLVLYGSQRGNAERLAEEIAERMPHELSPSSLRNLARGAESYESDVTVVPKLLTLDEFLKEGEHRWTRLVLIAVSSFGSGDAPMNARRFRRMCDGWIRDLTQESSDGSGHQSQFLRGMHFALIGFGDSYYTKTFQKNPMVVEQALTMAGATRVGERGVVDADKGDDHVQTAIRTWVDTLWCNLAKVIVQDPLTEDILSHMQQQTELSA